MKKVNRHFKTSANREESAWLRQLKENGIKRIFWLIFDRQAPKCKSLIFCATDILVFDLEHYLTGFQARQGGRWALPERHQQRDFGDPLLAQVLDGEGQQPHVQPPQEVLQVAPETGQLIFFS